ncbi:UDP-glucose 4-epimerase family protein [Vibrio coralliilyticus]|uniref:UDP-glucose 4-epimerase family protein n=1 Tax=Vibrio coralliilyticus TaxID=190893 RepID=UPI00148C5472|nr:SDR family oxidoreductase [Vibrio coralliilyticus]
MHKVLLTGFSGFIGSSLLERLKANYTVCLLGRNPPKNSNYEFHEYDLGSPSDLELTEVKTVIHCAARAHVMKECVLDPLSEYRLINTLGTIALAKQAAACGVKRFIFISSIKVNGDFTLPGKPFKPTDKHQPNDFYSQSKSEAEEGLLQISEETDLEVVIIRPTLVYGPRVKANFESLIRLVSKGLPLPFASITNNKRSLVSIANLVDLIVTCIEHPRAANEVFLVSDDHDKSTSELVRQLAKSLGTAKWQLPVPRACYDLVGNLMGKERVVERLLGSLQVDITHTKETLAWAPPQTVEEGFEQTAIAFLQSKNSSKNDSYN